MVKKSLRNHSNECQYYITLSKMQTFDRNFVAFGRVIEGFKLLLALQESETYLQRPINLIKVVKSGEYVL
jgi:cyclophilin family peptidyl-prolyl cis-trans isomerase